LARCREAIRLRRWSNDLSCRILGSQQDPETRRKSDAIPRTISANGIEIFLLEQAKARSFSLPRLAGIILFLRHQIPALAAAASMLSRQI